jgi:pimeloyl-ACP methyl ester carboxylesterase
MIKKVALTAGLGLALATGIAAYKSNRNDMAAEASHPPLGEFITIDGTRVHYLIEGDGPPIVLLHGAGGNLRDFTFELSGKLAETYTVISYDRPGHGYTDTLHDEGESLAEQAALLKSATDALGFPSAIIAGYSFGGGVALAWGLDYPNATDGLILMNAVSNPCRHRNFMNWRRAPSQARSWPPPFRPLRQNALCKTRCNPSLPRSPHPKATLTTSVRA